MTAVAELYRVSPAQEGMLFHSRTSPIDGCYVELTTFRIRGELDQAALTAAWRTVFARHPVLRTGFAWEGIRTPHQVVVADAEPRIDFADLTGLTDGERAAYLAAETERRRSERFDLTRPPLMRLLVARCPGEHLLIWTYHHLLLDGWSAGLLLAEVANLLAGAEPGPVPPPYRDYVQWILRRPPGPAREFWTSYLSGVQPAPADSGAGTYRTARLRIPQDRTAALRQAAVRNRITLSELFESAWGIVLSRFSGRDDVVFGTATAGRPPELPGAGEMVGMFVNTVPVRVRPSPDIPVSRFLEEYRSGRRRLHDHQYLPLPDIQACAAIPAGTALFDTLVAFENYPESALPQDSPVSVEDIQYETRTNYGLTLVIRIGDDLTVQAIGRHRESDLDQRLRYLETVLTRLSTTSPATVREIGALPEDTLRRIAELTTAEPGEEISALLAQHAHETPDASALGSTTYRELDHQVNAAADRLRGQGIRQDDRVACQLGTTAELVTALLAIDRIGARWTPPDAHPAVVLTADGAARQQSTVDETVTRHVLSTQPAALARRIGLNRSDVVLLQADPTPAELLAPIAAGATLICAPTLTSADLDNWITRFGVTTLLADPSRLITRPGLRTISTGLPTSPWPGLWWLRRHPATGLCLAATEHDPSRPGMTPMPGAAVLDDAGDPVPFGVPGALTFGGHPTGERARLLPDGQLDLVAPAGSTTEATVLRLFREALGDNEITPDDDFFDRGGDSAGAVALAGLIRSEFGGELDPELVFDCPTARELAAALPKTETRGN